MKTGVFYIAVFFLLTTGVTPVDIIAGPEREETPPDYIKTTPEGIRHTIDDDFAGATWVDAADINGDGYLDVVGSSWGNAEIAWWANDGRGGNWTKHTITTGFIGAMSVVAADVDGDGRTDVVGAAKMAGDVVWWRNEVGDGKSWTRYDIAGDVGGLVSIAAADINGDGHTDVLGQSSSDPARAVLWWANPDGDGTVRETRWPGWEERVVEDEVPGVRFARAADFDLDGDLDVLAAAFHITERKISWYENDGTGGGWAVHRVAASPDYNTFYVATADLDADGDMDIIAANNRRGAYVIWFENDGGGRETRWPGWEYHLIDDDFEAPYVFTAADLDRDGDVDLVGTSNSWDTIAWWENADGSGDVWNRRVLCVDFDMARDPVVGDFDRDGDIDVACAAFGAGAVAWWDLN